MAPKINASIPVGILIEGSSDLNPAQSFYELDRLLHWLGLQEVTQMRSSAQNADHFIEVRLQQRYFDLWCPGFDTLQVRTLALDVDLSVDQTLENEVVLTMLAAPQVMTFKSVAQLESHIRVRVNIARASAKTSLAFNTEAAERPSDTGKETPKRGLSSGKVSVWRRPSSLPPSPQSQVVSMSFPVIERLSI
ncbi:hypothetical protein [Limnohabitans sp.]|uniref:hypothetical protein n=1 Tax=Limnohabitans sp. TaxID=1907725 RepID=UPI0039BD5800|nr:hypothetical protein [Comamonadaceae bacterium]